MFHSPEGETALEIGHISKFSTDNSHFSWHFHFHNIVPHLCQKVELPLPPPTSTHSQPLSLLYLHLSHLCKPL